MPSLQVREVPSHIYHTLRELADREHRSLAQEVIAVLEKGLGLSPDPGQRRRQVLEDARTRHKSGKPFRYPDPAKLIRADRDR